MIGTDDGSDHLAAKSGKEAIPPKFFRYIMWIYS